ncbi:hypothetical protein HHL16_10330 [Pseudoflavitalea sp. G-6-1-2]|uniref:hypothetical protein n=1 Tax=Pseudoflavitalea sp. G-6-1-2 TaxID=2728841 RepID=UPI00146C9F8C|nr:hypothetical protein [Pseudoflavitalea sp. G-6-1-2]NML21271.1 hypothetical protein [Pseudoflavitalea sp. G-6-1-2]
MKSKYKFILLSLGLGIATTASVALAKGWFIPKTESTEELPDANSEWQKIAERYQQFKEGLYIKGTIRLFDSKHPGIQKEQNEMVLLSKGTHFFYSIGGNKTFSDGNRLLQIDPINQIVVLSKVDSAAASQQQQKLLPHMLNSFSDAGTTNTFNANGTVEGNSKERKLTIQNDMMPDIKKYSFSYAPANYLIKEAEIEWWKGNPAMGKSNEETWITKILYTHPPFPGLDIQAMISSILIETGGKTTLTGEVKDYELKVLY